MGEKIILKISVDIVTIKVTVTVYIMDINTIKMTVTIYILDIVTIKVKVLQ